MKKSIQQLLMFVGALVFVASCQENAENPSQVSDADVAIAENEAITESTFENIDDISYESMLYFESNGRIEESEDSPIRCAVKTHDKENKTITIDFGDGCEDRQGRIRKGKIIITYTDRRFVPGAVHTMTFEDFYIDDVKVEGTRIRTNISATEEDYLRFKIELIDGKLTWEDGSSATREASWEVTRVRTPNPINDQRIRTGSANGVNKAGIGYTIEITKPIVWVRGCLPAPRVMIPVEGTKVKSLDNGTTITIDYGDGTCDTLMDITKDGVTRTVDIKDRKKNSKD